MTRSSLSRVWAVGLLVCFCTSILAPSIAGAQAVQSQEAELLDKAHGLETHGKIGMAQDKWQQVLLINPRNPDALAGIARAYKLEGKIKDSEEYLNRLRAVNPNDPNIQRIETMGTQQDEAGKLQEAGRLSQAGQYARAMEVLRDVYGTHPPAGEAALSYYQTEAATPDGQPDAIAHLRELMDKYPQDTRYQVALGRILTYNPRTRAEGRKLLEKHPYEAEAQQGLRKSFDFDPQSPETAAYMKQYLAHHSDPQLASELAANEARRGGGGQRVRVAGPPPTPEQRAARAAMRVRNAEQQAAYNALNAKHMDVAEARFKALQAKNPHDFQAAAGLGYVRMNQSNFGGAISYFEQAEQDGDKDPAVERALRDSRFYYTMQTATAALNENNLPVAEQEFRAALMMRPNDPTALQGLGGTLLKGQQNERALEVFTTYVRVAPGDRGAWRGLFMAEYGAGRYGEALNMDRRVPPKVKTVLLRDPDYLRTLASVYLALGQEAEAERVLHTALDLPFPVNGSGLQADVEMQYAALLSTANRKEQAIALYRQVLVADPNNATAWIGLVQNEHQIGDDSAAYEGIRTMPTPAYTAAMAEAGFETTVAAVYEDRGHVDLAQQVLVQFLANQKAAGKQPFAPAEIQLAGIYMRQGNSVQAYPLYQSVLNNTAGSADAWNGLLSALHATGHDQEALAQLQAIPPSVRKDLENNPAYLQTVGQIYASLGDSQEALRFFTRVQQHYSSQHAVTPADLDIQEGWLLYNSHSDQALLPHLLALGDRKDLNDQQRLTVETIWANFAVRRANEFSARGNYRMALAILNAAARSFPNNQAVLRALATGYASAGMPKEAVAIFKSQDLNAGLAGDYRAAVGAALSAHDLHDAETWLRFGLDQYPRDPQMLILAARFEAARGDPNRAAEYYRAALAAMPPANPGTQLASELSQPAPQPMMTLPARIRSQDLATLLAAPDNSGKPSRQQPMQIRPYLPSNSGGTGTLADPSLYGATGYATGTQNSVQGGLSTPGESSLPSMPATDMSGMPGASGYTISPGSGYAPGGAGVTGATGGADICGFPSIVPQAQPPSSGNSSQTPHNTTLKDYTPKSRVEPLEHGIAPVQLALGTMGTKMLHLHVNRAMEAKFGPYVTYDPAAGVPHFVGARTGLGDGVVTEPDAQSSGITAKFASAPGAHAALRVVSFHSGLRTPQQAVPALNQSQQPQPIQQPTGPNGDAAPMFSPRPNASTPATMADGTLIVPYATIAHPAVVGPARQTVARAPSAEVRRRAAAIRANQANATPQMTGVSQPPTESYDTDADSRSAAALNSAAYVAYGQQPTGQVAQPNGAYSSSAPYGNQAGQQPQQAGDSNGQQYPQPGTHSTGRTGTATSGTGRRRPQSGNATSAPAPEQPPVAQQQQTPMEYPMVGQPLENMGPPQVGAPYPLGQAPTDYQLQQRNLPPLRAYYDPRVDASRPLSERQQAELDLAQIEGSYSGWLGGSVIGRYRSGTPGVDRLAALSVPFEASFVFNNQFRLSIIPEAVFLNSGTLNTAGGALGTGPILGTYLASATTNPSQQFASGIGGEVQLATNTIAISVGVTPYEFLVTNLIGRGRWRPANGHFTLYGGRDPVEETQLSYAGLRDPGTATTTYGGNVWGGVLETGGGVRFESGDARSGLYVQAEGGALTGYHVLTNQKVDALAGAYFRAKEFPGYGTLNVGGTMYGMHFSHNERGETYGLGGYFSPEAYFLAAVPVSFSGHYGTDLHYTINGSLGVQTFQEDNETYFPLDPGLLAVAGCTNAQLINRTCGLPANSSTGFNFSFDSEVSYRVNEHWYVGAFISANNTNNYDTVQGGFFARYTFRPQYPTVDYPTGLFPVEGFRPLRVP